MQTVTQVRDGSSLAHRAALRFAEFARPFSVVVAIFSAAVLLAMTTTSSYAKNCSLDDKCTEDLVVVGNNGALFGGSVSTFAPGSAGNNKPLHQIIGHAPGFDGVSGVAISPDLQDIAVGNQLANDILQFGAGSTGNSAPSAVIIGPDTGNNNPTGTVFLQGDDEDGIFAVANTLGVVIAPDSGIGICAPVSEGGAGFSLGTITEFFEGDSGDVIPLNNSPVVLAIPPIPPGVLENATIGGCLSFLGGPTGLASDSTGKLWVVNSLFGYVTSYADDASGDAFPDNIIGSGVLSATGGEFVAVDGESDGEIFVTDAGTNTIQVFDTDTFFGTLVATISGRWLHSPMGIDSNGDEVYVAINGRNSFLMYDNDFGQLEAGGSPRFNVRVQGGATGLHLPTGLAVPHPPPVD